MAEEIKKQIDTNQNQAIEEKELLDFLEKGENMKLLSTTLEQVGPETLLAEIPSLKGIIESLQLYNILQNDLLNATPNIPSLKNLLTLGIDIHKQKNNKPINWTNLVKNIKTSSDVGKITEETLGIYLDLSTTNPEDTSYILANFQAFLGEYLVYFPYYKSPLIDEKLTMTGMTGTDTEGSLTDYKKVLNKYKEKGGEKMKIGTDFDLSNTFNQQLFKLHIKTLCAGKSDVKQQEIFKNLFTGRQANGEAEQGLLSSQDPFLQNISDIYINLNIQPYLTQKVKFNANEETTLLDMTKISYFERFHEKASTTFDELYETSKSIHEMYEGMKQFGIDRSIPLDAIQTFNKNRNDIQQKINKLEEEKEKELKEYHEQNKYVDSLGYYGKAVSYGKNKAIFEQRLALEESYVNLLLQKTPKPTGKLSGISGLEATLDFDAGNTLDAIIRESFGEKVEDQRKLFKYNIKNDRQAAFGSFTGMVGGIAGSAVVAISTQNLRATSAGFTAGLRLGNGVGQEVRNAGEFVYEQASGNTISDGRNKVDAFGTGFMRGVGAWNENDERIGTEKFLSGLGFDYLSTVATFGLGQKFAPLLDKIGGVKLEGMAIGKGLKFGMEELVLESFLVDIPMNITQTGFETYFGIANSDIMTGQTAMGKNRNSTAEQTKSGDLKEALTMMIEAGKQNLSFDNLSQVFFNTVAYGGLLEGGGGAIKKIKSYLPATAVSDFTKASETLDAETKKLTDFMTDNNISVNQEGKFIDATTKQPIVENDSRVKELTNQLAKVSVLQTETVKKMEYLQEMQAKMVADQTDPNYPKGILFRLGLVNDFQTPNQIIDTRLAKIEADIKAEQGKSDGKKLEQLQKLRGEYIKAKEAIANGEVKVGEENPTTFNILEDGTIVREGNVEIDQIQSTIVHIPEDVQVTSIEENGVWYAEYLQEGTNVRETLYDETGNLKIFLDPNGENMTPSNPTESSSMNFLQKQREKLKQKKEATSSEKVDLNTDTTPSKDLVKENAKLDDNARIQKANELLEGKTLTEAQKTAILEAHNQERTIYNMTNEQIRARAEILEKAEFTSEEISILFKNGIVGNTNTSEKIDINERIAEIKETNPGIFDFLKKCVIDYKSKDGTNMTKTINSVKELYDLRLELEAEKKGFSKEEFDLRFNETLKFFSEDKVKFRETTGKIVEGNIEQYGENLLGKKLFKKPIGKKFFNDLKIHMFNQCLDNPLQYCSHGFDHSILVDAYVQNIIKGTPQVITETIEKYKLTDTNEIMAEDQANLLLRLTAVFHDFGYPDVGDLPKQTHAPLGAKLFLNQFAANNSDKNNSDKNNSFRQLLQESFGINNDITNTIIKDMGNAIFFHSADKVEQTYLNKVSFTKGNFLFGAGEVNPETIEILREISDKGEELTLTYREGSEEGQRNATTLQKALQNSDINVKVMSDNLNLPYGEYSSANYQGRKLKIGDVGLEFKSIDLMTNPLEGIVRLADNMDMSRARLTEAQSDPLCMNTFYNLGITNTGEDTSPYLFQQMEEIETLKKDIKDAEEKNDIKTRDRKQNELNEKKGKVMEKVGDLLQKGTNLLVFDEKTGKQKETIRLTFSKEDIANIIDKDGNYNLNYYKSLVVQKLSENENIKGNPANLKTIQNIFANKNSGSYSFRHFAGLTAIKNVKLTTAEGENLSKINKILNSNNKIEEGTPMLEVVVNRDIFLHSDLSNQTVKEINDKIKLNEYHIWRLYDASGKVSVNGKLLNINVVDENGNLIGLAYREKATDSFKLFINEEMNIKQWN